MVKDNTGKWSGMINVRLETLTQSAEIAGMAYGLATNGLEYVGIGISENNLMVCFIKLKMMCSRVCVA